MRVERSSEVRHCSECEWIFGFWIVVKRFVSLCSVVTEMFLVLSVSLWKVALIGASVEWFVACLVPKPSHCNWEGDKVVALVVVLVDAFVEGRIGVE